MRFLGSFLGKKEKTKVHTDKEVSGKCLELLNWRQYLDNMLASTHYISRKEFMAEIAPYSEAMKFFISLEENDILTDYCVKNGFDPDCARDLCQQYEYQDISRQRFEIAKKHERSYGAIKARLMKHGLIN